MLLVRRYLGIATSVILAFFLLSIIVATPKVNLTEDAIILALRIQYENQSGIWLDSIMAAEIDSGLRVAREEVDILQHIHVFQDYVLNELIVQTDSSWNSAWHKGEITTGEPYIDSLSVLYGLIGVEGDRLNLFLLKFATPLEMWQLSELYEEHSDVLFAEPNLMDGDGDDIEYFKKNDVLHFAFSRGWGDCPAGCIERYYWYVSSVISDSDYVARLEEEKYRDFSEPYIYRWNIPPRYAMTMFENADSIFQAILSSHDWWVRRHCIEGTWRFFFWDYPWVGEDINSHWDDLKTEFAYSRNEVIDVLVSALSDPDLNVGASAENALNEIEAVKIESELVPTEFTLHQPYPNPFNPTTTIEFSIPQNGLVTLIVYDVLGREAETILNKHMQAGHHKVQWNASNVPSGIYFVRMESGDFSQVMKGIVVR